MPPAEPFPLFFPGGAPRAFGDDDLRRRVARTLHFDDRTRVLEVCSIDGGALLSDEFGCRVTPAEVDDRGVDALRQQLKPGAGVEVQKIDLAKLPFADGAFDAILALGRVPLSLRSALSRFRRVLAPKGRLVLTYPVKVGRFPAKIVTEVWAQRLGEPLLLPRELLQEAEKSGYEPESIETLSDAELQVYYQEFNRALSFEVESDPKVASARQELELHRSQGTKASVTFALLFARRKEPGEKPMASRDTG